MLGLEMLTILHGKLAWILKGEAGQVLARDTYEKEQLPVAKETAAKVFEDH